MEGLKGKRILVTGGTGFVGSHLVENLIATGAQVIVPFRSLDPRSYFAVEKIGQRTLLTICDLKDQQRVLELIAKYEIEWIFHLAAWSVVPTAYYDPWETIATNVMGTTNILEAARRVSSVKGVIVASSDKAYGKSQKPYRETDALRGDHPYDASKASMDLITYAYFKTYRLPVIITRFGNIYGPGDFNFSRIIPGVMKSLITKEPLILRSDGTYVRDYLYVKDVVNGYLLLLSRLDNIVGEAFNFSSVESLSVVALIKKVEKILNKKVKYIIKNTSKNEIPYQHLDSSKVRRLGWKSKYSFSKGINETYSWYRKNKWILS